MAAAAAESARKANIAIKAIDKFTNGAQKPIGLDQGPIPCVPSGSLHIDNLIGGTLTLDKKVSKCPGYPRRRITEIYGQESSGKTTLTLESIVQVQKEGGIAMFLDFEHALDHGYAKSLGVDFDPRRLMLYQPDDMEQGLDMMRIGITIGVDLIIVDSVAAMVPAADMIKNFKDPDKIGHRALKLASALPKLVKMLKPSERNGLGSAIILINQTRATIGGNAGAPVGTSGGHALKFFAYLRLQTSCVRTERITIKDPVTKKEKKVPFGSHTQVKVIKSKIDAKQGQTADIFIRYGKGIDDFYTVIEAAVAHRLVRKSGAFFEFQGQKFQGRDKFRAYLVDNAAICATLEKAVLEAVRSQAEDAPEEEEGDDVDSLITSAMGSGDDDAEDEEVVTEEVELEVDPAEVDV